MKKTINVARDFSKFPAGRRSVDGKFSGEVFRQRLLEPPFRASADIVEVQLDGTYGYGSSFLEEAFGGLVRALRCSPQEVKSRLSLVTADPSLSEEIFEYIDNAN